MWELANRTPFAAGGTFVRDSGGAEFWSTTVVGVFQPEDGRVCRLLDAPEILFVPRFTGEQSTVLDQDSDFAPFRPCTDVILRGVAVAPRGNEADQIEVSMDIGKLSRRIEMRRPARLVRGRWNWKLEKGDPVRSVPLGWSLAMGGRDAFAPAGVPVISGDNPVGRGWSTNMRLAQRGDSLDLPQQWRPGETMTEHRPPPLPAGTGFVHPAWDMRRRHAGSFDAGWQKAQAPLLPQDFHASFYQAAPSEQVYPGDISGGEPVSISGMDEAGGWQFRLPQALMSHDCRIAGRSDRQRLRIVSVQIDAAARQVRMVWNATTRCTGREHQLERTTVRLEQMSRVQT